MRANSLVGKDYKSTPINKLWEVNQLNDPYYLQDLHEGDSLVIFALSLLESVILWE